MVKKPYIIFAFSRCSPAYMKETVESFYPNGEWRDARRFETDDLAIICAFFGDGIGSFRAHSVNVFNTSEVIDQPRYDDYMNLLKMRVIPGGHFRVYDAY